MEVLRHTRSTRHEATKTLLLVGGTIVGFIVLQQLLFPDLPRTDPWFFGYFWLIVGIVLSIASYYGFINYRAKGEFVCWLDEAHLECISPVARCGETFKIALGDIAKVEKKSSGDSHTWYLYDRSGRRYWLTSCYSNPADAFVAVIKDRNPAVVEVDSY